MIARAAFALLVLCAAPAAAEEKPVVPGIWLIEGGFEPGRQPDGNSVLIEGPDGLLLVDTGRHASHTAKIEAAIAARGKPLVRIVNTHWHLDHVSGNLTLKAKHPNVRVSASDAIDGALTGFLKRSADSARPALEAGKIPEPMASEVRGDLATFARGNELRPDNVVRGNATIDAGGRKVELHLTRNAATAGDVWLYDPQSRVLVAGDLVTDPVPFLDTACPDGWLKALDAIAATPFATLVPGHGGLMSQASFIEWKQAFAAFLDCARGTQKPSYCTAAWYDSQTAHSTPPADKLRILTMADYYVGRIRSGELDKNCAA
ncbi:MBL fold metallo-hydrolase [Sphingomonas sp. BT-65]|uniref:MBL fold metallo-hydrolase n=1 Tax=Sphingomonas sp. BT-65 TaxID=2989821 RepID=UPI0022354A43|nr:MBL fold metallo-hydrolase [Sphingomonas sp. BT-65]MCW4461601.1 MBL fold metallo-hydrolase [Sphingomonas sp. BT-65]